MGRRAKVTFPLTDGRVVGASPKVRGEYFRVQFPSPTEPGKYVEVATGVEVPKGWTPDRNPPADWYTEAAKLILKAYSPTLPHDLRKVTWDRAVAELEKSPIRPKTLITYQTAINNLRAVLPDSKGPGDITPELATRFVRLFAAATFKRGKASDSKAYTRSPQTVFNAVANLSIVWSHFSDLGFLKENPWAKVKRPRLAKRAPSIPGDDAIEALFGWLEARYPGWELLRLFVEVKMLSGCRLNDLCQVRSDQLQGEILTIRPDQDKTHRERVIPLPAELAGRLHAVKGPTYLWERYVEDTKTYRPGPRRADTFTPYVMYNAVKSIFREYGRRLPDKKVKTHDLRKRAITLTVLATGGNVDRAAQAIGIDPQTARDHYIDAQRSFDGQELMKKMAAVLLPQKAVPESGGKS